MSGLLLIPTVLMVLGTFGIIGGVAIVGHPLRRSPLTISGVTLVVIGGVWAGILLA